MNFPITLLQLAMPSLWINTLCAATIAVTRAEDSDIDRDLSSPYLLRNHGNIRHRHQEIVENNESQLRRHRNEFRPHRLLRPEGALSWCRANSCSPISAARPHCDAATGMCVECLVDEHCHSLYDDKTLECVLDNVNSCKKKKHMAPIAMIRTESTMASSGSSSSSRLPSTDAPIPIPCLYDDECPAEEPICEDLSKRMCFNPPCGYCKSEAEISVTNPTIQAIKTTAQATSTSTSREPIIPTTRSGIELASLWPNGNELADYTSCNFDCCTNEDCDSMADSNGRLIGGCCIEGTCQLKNIPDEICWDVIGPPADVICGYDAWMNYKGDGHCEPKSLPATTSKTKFSSTVSSSSIKSTPAIPTTSSGIRWPNGDELADYTSCNFDCCTNEDCDSMADSNGRLIGGCCVEGTCQLMNRPDGICWDVIGPPADVICGYDAWMNYKGDGHCETQAVPTIPTSSSDPMKAQGSKTTIANFVTTTSPVSDITTTSGMSDMPDYSSCNFSCCSKRDCRYMVDSLNRIVGGCCVEGYCEAKSNPRGRCPSDVFADGADTELRLCGFDSWVAFHNDGCVIDDSEFI